MSIIKYEIFESVIKTGSFTKAAEKSNRTQSAISHAISSLEKELGVPLFVRDGRKISLTPYGIKVYTYICKILEINRELMKLNFFDELHPDFLKIGVFTSVQKNILPLIIKEFNGLYPSIEIIMFEGTYDEIQDWVLNKVIDFGFTISCDFGCESIPFLEDKLVIATPNNLKFCPDNIDIFFKKNKIIMPTAPYKHQIEIFFNKTNIVPNIHSYITDCNTIVKMISLGIGISIGPKLFFKEFDNIKLYDLPVVLHRNIYISYRKGINLNNKKYFIQEFINIARNVV